MKAKFIEDVNGYSGCMGCCYRDDKDGCEGVPCTKAEREDHKDGYYVYVKEAE